MQLNVDMHMHVFYNLELGDCVKAPLGNVVSDTESGWWVLPMHRGGDHH